MSTSITTATRKSATEDVQVHSVKATNKTTKTKASVHGKTRVAPEVSTAKKQTHNIELGRKGEDAAACYLERRGYDIVARNWKCKAGEVDIVARDNDCIIFVEVKTRSNVSKGMPEDAITSEKRKKYEKIAAMFLQNYECGDAQIRFDVVAILVIKEDRAIIRHHLNAFGAA